MIKEKVDRDLAMEGCFKPLGQTESLESQLPRLSSFNVAKMAQTAKQNYTLEEAMSSPAVMLEILDSLPDESEGMQASGGELDEEGSKSSLVARQELKADVRQTLIVLNNLMKKMSAMTGQPLLDPVKPPRVATPSSIEKLPPITNQYLTTAPLQWGNEKKSGSSDGDSASPNKGKADEVVKDGIVMAINKKYTTCGAISDSVAAEKAAAEKAAAEKEAAEKVAAAKAAAERIAAEREAAEKAAAERIAAERAAAERAAAEKAAAEKAAAEKAAFEKAAAEKVAKKAKIQAKIAELERAMQVEMQKLKQMDEEPATASVESEIEEMKKMADRIIESAKERRIAKVEAAVKERQEAIRIAELERVQQEAKLAKEKKVKTAANSEAEKLRRRAEYDQRMAEFDRIAKNSKDYRIAQVEVAIKERQEATRIAELERAQQEKKLAKEKQAKSEAEKWRKRAEYDQRMAEFDRIAKEQRITKADAAAKEKQEALKEAELEKDLQEKVKAKASPKKTKIDVDDIAWGKKDEIEAKLAKELREEMEANLAMKNQAQLEAKLAKEKQAEEEAKLAKDLALKAEKQAQMAEYEHIINISTCHRIAMVENAKLQRLAEMEPAKKAEEDARLAEAPQVEKETKLAKEKADMEAKLAKEKQAQMAEYDRIINTATEHRIAMVEKAKRKREEARLAAMDETKRQEEIARLASMMSPKIDKAEEDARLAKAPQVEKETKLAKEKAEMEAKLAKEKEAQMAEYDCIINTATNYRIAMVEKAKRKREEARFAAMDETKREEEIARLASMMSPKIDKVEEDAKLAKVLASQAEKQAQMAEYDRIINAATDYRIAMVEKAKRKKEEARLAAMDETKREEEKARLASMVSPEIDKAEEPEMKKCGEVTEERGSQQAAKEVEEEIPEQQDSGEGDIAELQKSYVQPIRSLPRPPTPPAGHPRMHHSHTSLFGAQMSLRTINEGGGACDFTPEFASPLITHSMHAVVPYMSLRTRLGLHQTEMMTDKELGEEMRRLSEATLVIKKEMMKRKHSSEQAAADVSRSVMMTACVLLHGALLLNFCAL